MKFSLAPLAFAVIAATSALAQESSSASSSSMSSAAPSSSSSSAPASTPAPSSSQGGEDGGSSQQTVCQALPGYDEGRPLIPNYGCDGNTTSTPTYDSTKLQSYLIGGHTRGPEGEHISDVATELAKSVTNLYPSLTISFSDLAHQYVTAIEASISGVAAGTVKVDGAITQHANKIWTVAAAAVAVVAGGAFAL
ncbi:hypothetical protein BDZ90DRAFT_156209 [Jaminaea rosea]|uniref:Uncharacterized protein n=1 Tax=Jaminaea rosea TaxID=1569628 RepID=A0A316UXN7_9BASI|nr:hypothetical protein BDZ90DRAFT_156209 [Jaminaea rosea]PWN27905.1 hypothetical protein BDZ90DRAFT_156209 [Jaminaea rosea]